MVRDSSRRLSGYGKKKIGCFGSWGADVRFTDDGGSAEVGVRGDGDFRDGRDFL